MMKSTPHAGYESLLDNIPVYWKPLNWFSSSEDDNVLQDMNVKYETELDDVLWLIVEETEQEMYKDTAEFEKAKHNFETFFDKAQMWEKLFSNMFMVRTARPYSFGHINFLCSIYSTQNNSRIGNCTEIQHCQTSQSIPNRPSAYFYTATKFSTWRGHYST